MTQFAYYYIGIGSGVLLVSYFQVSVLVCTALSNDELPQSCINILLYHHLDHVLGVSSCKTNSENQKNVLQKSDADGDWVVRLQLCG